jgi:glycosyltransferase involved in cell wall biosynthesis
MHGGSIALARQFMELKTKPDLILGSSMLDMTGFLALTRNKWAGIPVAMYFHENQLTYPWSPQDRDVKHKRDNHYAFINYISALAADSVLFNSHYHFDSFLQALPDFLNQFPDRRGKENIKRLEAKCEVLHLGMDLTRLDAHREESRYAEPILLWNHRWEYDKEPQNFFDTLIKLKEKGLNFKLVVLGERNEMIPKSFELAKQRLSAEILHWGYTADFETYARWLWQADILPVSSKQDFFGGSVVEAMYCNCLPLLPNRLAYPGHIPEAYRPQFLYEEGEFANRLETMIRNHSRHKTVQPRDFVTQYDWKQMIGRYDLLFSELII